ncbi:hypothetical protein BZA77DRAFT_302838 [Pyronema omphalodes]|nr:hypothetical protein BZA77DRAFT_302838 [Pyronema omphalodes]
MFSTPFFSPYSGGGNPFFCRPRQQPQYPREQCIDPFFSSLFSKMGDPTPSRAPACRHSTANLRAPTPARQLHRPQSTANMRAPGAGPVRHAQKSQNSTHRPSHPMAKQLKPQVAKKEPQYKTYETEESYRILASLPEGTDKKSIGVRFLDDDMLVISGDVETEVEIETETETETEDESESESEDDSDVESQVESESESDIEAELETESRSLQPYVEDVDDIDDPRTPRAKASLQIRRGSCSSASSASSRSSFASVNLAKSNTPAKTSTSQLSKIQRTPKSSTPKCNTKQIKKQITTEQFSKKFQFPRPVEMRGVKARLEGDRLEIMVPKKRVVRVPSRMWYV